MKTQTPSRRDFLTLISAGAAASAAGLSISCRTTGKRHGAESGQPNVILIMTDDQGFGDLGFTGNPVIKTPHIDKMARNSARLTNFYVSPVCAPTRASLMTGRYNYRTRCIDTYIGRAMMDTAEVTLAELLKQGGYATGIFGKWHMGDNHPMRPMDQGFEESLVHRGGGIGQPSDPPGGEGKYTDPVLFHNGRQTQAKGYCTDVYFDSAIAWLTQCGQQGRPFFAYIPTNAPHGPFHDVPEAQLAAYQKENLDNDQFPQAQGHKLPAKHNADIRARIFAMITNVDDNVGKLFRSLEKQKLLDNTLVIFMVDNGPNGRRYVAGMKGWKSHVHEGGIHSPFFAHWPKRLKPGCTSDRIAAHIDILPTVLDVCGLDKPADLKLDGRSLLPLLTGKSDNWSDRMIVIQAHRGDRPQLYHNFAARTQQWKLLHASGFGKEGFTGDPAFELYDMAADPMEMHNLAAAQPAVVEKLRKQYEDWFADVSTTRPDNYAPPAIHIGTPHENPVVLTRQDWRHIKGRPWAADSNGFWKLHAATEGRYDVRLRFRPLKADAAVTLAMGGQTLTDKAKAQATECLFTGITLKKGPLELLATLTQKNNTQGPWQVDVIRK